MRLLLDTHTLMWWDGRASLLSKKAREALTDNRNTVFLSVVNAWEMQIKVQSGKLTLHKTWQTIVREQIDTNNFQFLGVEFAHIEALDSLPFHHRDPFDRLLIAQAIHEGLTLVSNDSKFTAYPVPLLW